MATNPESSASRTSTSTIPGLFFLTVKTVDAVLRYQYFFGGVSVRHDDTDIGPSLDQNCTPGRLFGSPDEHKHIRV